MTRRAFVMGSNGSENLGSLKYAAKDAREIAAALSGPRCGFVVDSPKNVRDVFDLRRELYESASSCEIQDTFLCYFSGHGILDQGELFLVWDNTNANIVTSALPVSDVLTAIKRSQASNKLLILDCCHAGGAVGLKDASGVPIEELQIKEANHLVLMASDRLEKARELDEFEGSFLSTKIKEALTDKFYDADKDGDQKISIQDLMSWLEESSAKHNSSSQYKVPQPFLFGQKKGNFFLTLDGSDWDPPTIPWPDGSNIVLLPVAPINVQKSSGGHRFDVAVGIAKHPITNAQYESFVAATGKKPPEGERFIFEINKWKGPFYPWEDPEFNDPQQPVVCVSLHDAIDYCRWVEELTEKWMSELRVTTPSSVILRPLKNSISEACIDLPPHRLWDFAAFGTEYPILSPTTWLTQTKEYHHPQDQDAPALIETTGLRTNKRGISDMIGNVWEWCGEDGWTFNSVNAQYLKHSTRAAYLGEIFEPIEGREVWRTRVKGGGYLDDLTRIEPFIRTTELEEGPDTRHSDLGFRIAVQIPINYLPELFRLKLRMCKEVDAEYRTINSMSRGAR